LGGFLFVVGEGKVTSNFLASEQKFKAF